MNVQISPFANAAGARSTSRTPRDAGPCAQPRARLCIGGVAAGPGAGRLLVFHPCQQPAPRRRRRRRAGEGGVGADPQHGGDRTHHRHRGRQFHRAGDRPGPGPADPGLFQGRPDGQGRRSAVPDRSAALSGGLRQRRWPSLASSRQRAKADRYAALPAQNADRQPADQFDDAQALPICEAEGQRRRRRGSTWNSPQIRSPVERQDRPDPDPAGQHGRRRQRWHQPRRWSPSPRSSR